MTKNKLKTRWSWLAVLSVLTFVSVASQTPPAAAEPARTEQRLETVRMTKARAGALDKRVEARPAQLNKLAPSRVQLEREQAARAARMEKRR
jgi:hypothetical protein